MAKMSQGKRKKILGWLEDVAQELIDARRDDEGKSGHPALRSLLDANAHVVSYDISSVMYLENVRIGYREFYIDTHDGGWVGFYYTGHYDVRGYQDEEPEMIKLPLPREHRAAINNAILLFASGEWQCAIAKYGTRI